MFRVAVNCFASTARNALTARVLPCKVRQYSSAVVESDDAFDARYVQFFSKPHIDGWEIRKAINDLAGMDLVPDPKIVNAALRACRKVNDYAMAVRLLETIKFKCGGSNNDMYGYVMQEIKPTMEELGIESLEAMGYDKPELALASVYDIH